MAGGAWGRLGDFATAMLMATVVFLLIVGGQALHLVDRVQDDGADAFMSLFRSQLVQTEGRTPFAFIDVDEETYARWGEPLLTPRDRLACLINFARTSGARLVLVDFELIHPSQLDGPTAGDERLRRSLAEGPACGPCLAGDRPPAPVVLPRAISSGYRHPQTAVGRIRPSFLDPALEGAPGVFWAGTTFLGSPDGVVRRWLLWDASCSLGADGARLRVVPSMVLASLALLDADRPRTPDGIAREIERTCARGDCLHPLAPPAGCPVDEFAGWPVDLGSVEGRILFSFSWADGRPSGEDRIAVETAAGRVYEPFVRHVRADRIVDLFCTDGGGSAEGWSCIKGGREGDAEPSAHLLDGRIVVIGASFADARDSYKTPLGEMPGSMIIINAVHSILAHGVPARTPWWQRAILFAVQAVLLAAVFCVVRSPWIASMVAFVALMVATFALSRWLLARDVWLDASLAAFAIFLYMLLLPMGKSMIERTIGLARAMRRSLAILLLAVAGPSPATHAAGEPALFGTVIAYEQPSTAYRIIRENVGELAVRPLMDVVEGDRILVLGDPGWLTIERLDGRTIRLARQDSGYLVPRFASGSSAVPLGTWGRRALEATGSFVQAWWDGGQTRVTATSRDYRDGAIRIPLLERSPVKVASGNRALALQWTGGTPPFGIRIMRDGTAAPIAALEGRPSRDVVLSQVTLIPGRHRVEIGDAAGRTFVGGFEVVPAQAVPELPPGSGLDALPSDARSTAVAGWLAGRDNGAFAFESYLLVAPLADHYPPARGLRDALAAGKLPMN